MDLNLISTIVSIVSGLMTILGISGVVTWGFKNTETRPGADSIIIIFVYSIKFFINTIILAVLSLLAYMMNFGVVLVLKGHIQAESNEYWEKGYEFQHILSYLIVALLFIPMFLLLSATVYQWSFSPFNKFFSKFRSNR